jgi:hypothetical protein
MYHIWMPVFVVILFVLLTPGVLLRLPPRGSLLTAALVHGIMFTIVLYFSHKLVWDLTRGNHMMGMGMGRCGASCPCNRQ